MHEVQKILLKRLLGQNNQKYSQLTRGYSYEENILFHLKKLLSDELIVKDDGRYRITSEGVKKVAAFDLNNLEDTGFKTFFIGFLCRVGEEYLIKGHPTAAHNFYNLPSGKPRFGENIEVALQRSFFENAGIRLDATRFTFTSLHLKTVKTSREDVLFDDAFAIYEVLIDVQETSLMKLKNELSWMSVRGIQELKNRWPELDILILNNDRTAYMSYELTSDYIL